MSFKSHIDKLGERISPRNNLVDILANSSWGADPHMLRTTSLALCYSTAEYCDAVWFRSANAHNPNVELNKAFRTIAGTLQGTPPPALCRLSGMSPPDVRRETNARVEHSKQLSDPWHPPFTIIRRHIDASSYVGALPQSASSLRLHHLCIDYETGKKQTYYRRPARTI